MGEKKKEISHLLSPKDIFKKTMLLPPGQKIYKGAKLGAALVKGVKELRANEFFGVVSDEGDCELWKVVEDELKRAVLERKVRVRFMLGPVMSVDEDGGSPLLRLHSEKLIELYRRPFRQKVCYQIFGESKVCQQSIQWPLQPVEERFFTYLEDPAGYAVDLATMIEVWCPRPLKHPKSQLLCLTNQQIREWWEQADRLNIDAALMVRNEIRGLPEDGTLNVSKERLSSLERGYADPYGRIIL